MTTLIPKFQQTGTGVPDNVDAICNVAWTPEVVSAYQASQV